MKARHAAVYLRCSTKSQETEMQEAELREYVTRRGSGGSCKKFVNPFTEPLETQPELFPPATGEEVKSGAKGNHEQPTGAGKSTYAVGVGTNRRYRTSEAMEPPRFMDS
jgi:hypothetical protein